MISFNFNFLEGSRDFKPSTCFPACFSKAFAKGEYAKLAGSIIYL